jgi:tetratricopeptide (TPR) repeat protein
MLVDVSLPDIHSGQEALQIIRGAVPPQSSDYRDFLWLAEVLASVGEKKDAEAAARKALALRPSVPECWVALVVLLAEAGRKEEARAEMDRSQRELPAALRPLVLGPGREAVGEIQAAEAVYLDVVRSHPNDGAANRAIADFYGRCGKAAQAEPFLRSLVDGDGPHATWARRTLALALAATGEYRKTREALVLIDRNLKAPSANAEDQRARALVLARRPGDRHAAIEALEASFALANPTPSEEFLLARLYEADRNWAKANERLLALANATRGATPELLAYYIQALLRHDQVDDARNWFAKLEQMEPDSARTAEVRARLLLVDGKGDEAGQVLNEFARKQVGTANEPVVLPQAARLLSDLGRAAEAEGLFRLLVSRTEKTNPGSLLALAAFLGNHDRPRESLDLCDLASARCPVELVANVAVGCLRSPAATDADRKRVRNWLDAALVRNPDSVGLIVARGELLDACGDYDGSKGVYRNLLVRDANNLVALNNLAWLLAMQERKGVEALGLIEHAIDVAGPDGDLLDTQGSILLALDRPDEAAEKFAEAIDQTPTGQRCFHLALALEKTGKYSSACDAWLKAIKELNLSEKSIHSLERASFLKLQARFSEH